MAGTRSGSMRSTDAFTWHMERDPSLRSTVVAVIWLDRAPDWKVLQDRIERMSRVMPGMRRIVVETPVPLSTPRLVVDPHFDLSWHLRRVEVSAPRDREAVLELARQAAMDAFDRDRPLWEYTLVEGMKGGAAAFLVKIHHSLSDGVGGMRLLTVMFDLQREPSDLGPLPPLPESSPSSTGGLVTDALRSTLAGVGRLTRRGLGRAVPTAIGTARHPVSSARRSGVMARSVYRTAGPMLHTRSPVMRERAMTRHLAMFEVPLGDLRAAAVTVGATVNDAFLAALARGLREYHHRHGSPVESLRVTMPINLRAADDSEWGNRITLQRLTIPVEEADAAQEMRRIHEITEAIHEDPGLAVTDLIAGALNLLPSAYVGGVLKHIDFLASNVPGSPVPIYLAGGKVTGFFAFGPTIGSALNATLMSYEDGCDIGVNIDTAAVPDVDLLVSCLQEGLDQVRAVATAVAN